MTKNVRACLGILNRWFLPSQIFCDQLLIVLLRINITSLNYKDSMLYLCVVRVTYLRSNKAVQITSRVQIMYYLLVCHFQYSFFSKWKYKKHVISYDNLCASFYPDKCQI